MRQFSSKGKVLTEEHKKKIGDSRRAKKMPPDVVIRNSQNRIGKKQNTEWAEKTRKAGRKSGGGVYLDKKSNKYFSRLHFKNERMHLGTFDTYEEAVQARLEAENKYWD